MVGLTSVFLLFGNSLEALSQPPKDHLWSSTTNLGTSSDMLLSLMPSTSDGPAVPDDVFVNFYHETNDSESIATAPEIPQQAYDIPPREDATLSNISLDAGTSSRCRLRKMSQAMVESVSQREFFGKDKMHYMAAPAVIEHDYDFAHDLCLLLQD